MKKIILTLLVSMTALFLGSVRSSATPAMSEASDTVTVVKATGGPKTIVLVNPGDIVRADGVRRVKVGSDTKRKARAAAAVADGRRVVVAGGHVQLDSGLKKLTLSSTQLPQSSRRMFLRKKPQHLQHPSKK